MGFLYSVVRQVAGAKLPTFLKTKLYLDFSRPEQFEFAFDELVRTLHDAPLYEKPPITKSPFPATPRPAAPAKDAVKELMSIVIRDFELTTDAYLGYQSLVNKMGISRVMIDLLFAEAVEMGLLKSMSHDYYQLTNSGKKYALEKGLIK